MFEELQSDLNPVGQMEKLLVEKIAVNFWRMRRLLRYETGEVRHLLDVFVRKYLESDNEEGFSPYLNDNDKIPELEYFTISDQIDSDQLQKQQARIDLLRSGDLDYCADSDIIEYVLQYRLGKVDEEISAENRESAQKYLAQSTPQQKGKIRCDLLRIAEAQYAEMKTVLKWQRRIDITKLLQSIPVDPHITKVIKYETSLERSIFRNLEMLKKLQQERKK